MSTASEVRTTDKRRRITLLLLCAVVFAALVAAMIDGLGAGSRPWFGYWDANVATSARPFTVAIAQPRSGGASDLAGLRNGDLVDLREQNEAARIAVSYQLPANVPTQLSVRRGSSMLPIRVTGTTAWEGAPAWKLPTLTSRPLAGMWFVGCVFLIALRRRYDRDARILAIVLLCLAWSVLDLTLVVIPNQATLGLLFGLTTRAAAAGAAVLIVYLSAQFGTRPRWRTALEGAAYAAIAVGFAADAAGTLGLATLWFDPVPFLFRISGLRGGIDIAVWLLVSLCAGSAVVLSEEQHRARAGWLLLPLPVALLTSSAVATLLIVVKSWFANISIIFASSAIVLVSALIVTYALLKRRVLDLEFVLSRTLVVAAVSLIVVAAFALLEWLLGTVLAGVSHATGLVANAGLALVLGVSLNAIHKRADAFIDAAFFRKRHEDERALLDFSKEAAYVTKIEALLDQAIEKIRRHTDARDAALLLEAEGSFGAARSFGRTPPEVNENDAAVLALKTWHKPIDPHHYQTALHGALAVPMIARGRLFGILLLGERSGGEAYAPDEVEAAAQFAHGVGAALDALSTKGDTVIAAMDRTLGTVVESLAALTQETASLRADLRMAGFQQVE